VSETTANDIFNYWLPIIGELLPCSLLEQVTKFWILDFGFWIGDELVRSR
jgi:hypothetical protein